MPKMDTNKISTPFNLKGAVPPSELTGLQFSMDMTVDAINFHENGDDEDGPCCTGDNPCETRIFLVGRQRDLAKQILKARGQHQVDEKARIEEGIELESVARRTPGNGIVADPASEKQVAYITSLVLQHDTSRIGTFPQRTLTQIQAGEEVSKGRASKLIEVLKRQPKIQAEIHQAQDDATPAQLGFLRTLCAEQGEEVRTSYSKTEASSEIERLLKNRETPKAQTPKQGLKVTEDGMYQTSDGTVYKVQIAKQGSGRLYAKQLVEHKTETGSSWSFEYASGAIHRLTPADKMSLEKAQEFGKLYGVCCRCAADLTDERSIEAGIGPICAGKM